MYTNGNVQKLPIETIRIIYMKIMIELEIIMKEEENGWITAIPIFNGKHGNSFKAVNIDVAIKEISKRYNLEGLKVEDFSVGIESTDFAGVTE